MLEKTAKSSYCEVSWGSPARRNAKRRDVRPCLRGVTLLEMKLIKCLQWKGVASYFTFVPPDGSPRVVNRVWSYPQPTQSSKFAPIKDYLSFYAASGRSGVPGWKCYVEGEEVAAQEGDVSASHLLSASFKGSPSSVSQFYGGWVTDEIVGRMKGGPGTRGW